MRDRTQARIRPAARPRRATRLALAAVLVAAAGTASAGNQKYEELTGSVRTALASAIADRRPPEPLWGSPQERIEWLSAMADALPRRNLPTFIERMDVLNTVRYEAQRAGLEPELMLGLIQVESGFRRHAVSSAGARGLTQVMPFWTSLIGGGDPNELFQMRANIRYGSVILRHYLDIERGDLYLALGRYNGSRGRPEYPNAVRAAWHKWQALAEAARSTASRRQAGEAAAPPTGSAPAPGSPNAPAAPAPADPSRPAAVGPTTGKPAPAGPQVPGAK